MKRVYRDRKLTPEEAARQRELREKYQREKPTPADVVAAGGTLVSNSQAWALLAVGQELREERERQGLSLREVAAKAGMDEAALSRVETGRNPNPTVETLARVAAALGKRVAIRLLEAA